MKTGSEYGRSKRGKITPYLLVLPVFALSIIFFIGIISALLQSFGYIPSFGMREFSLKYYMDIFSRQDFIASVLSSLQISFVSSIFALVLGVLLAAALVYTGGAESKKLYAVKLAILMPHTIVALIVIALISRNGMISRLLYSLGIISSDSDFPILLYSKNNIGIIVSYVFKELPFVCYFTHTLLSNVNKTLGEAAENLGASRIKSFFYVSLPLCMPAIKKAFLIILAFSFGAYELPFILGPTVPKALPVLAHMEYTHPDLLHRPYAMALNGVILIISWIMAILYFVISREGKKDETKV